MTTTFCPWQPLAHARAQFTHFLVGQQCFRTVSQATLLNPPHSLKFSLRCGQTRPSRKIAPSQISVVFKAVLSYAFPRYIYIYILTTVPPCQEHWAKHIQAAARNISLACEICNVEKTQKQQRQNPCKTRTNKIWDNCFDTNCNVKNELKSTSQCNTKELSSYSHPTV